MSTTTDAPATAEIQHDVGQPDGAIAPIVFPQGLPGFPGATSFALRPLTDAAGELLVSAVHRRSGAAVPGPALRATSQVPLRRSGRRRRLCGARASGPTMPPCSWW